MTQESDPDDLGPDGYVRLRRYLPLADTHWFGISCAGLDGCGHAATVHVEAAIRLMGSGEATVGQLARRLRCGRCGKQGAGVVVCADSRPRRGA